MPKFRPVRSDRKKTATASRARQIGCVVWLALAFALIMWLFYAILRS